MSLTTSKNTGGRSGQQIFVISAIVTPPVLQCTPKKGQPSACNLPPTAPQDRWLHTIDVSPSVLWVAPFTCTNNPSDFIQQCCLMHSQASLRSSIDPSNGATMGLAFRFDQIRNIDLQNLPIKNVLTGFSYSAKAQLCFSYSSTSFSD